jgi:hypothetical protein
MRLIFREWQAGQQVFIVIGFLQKMLLRVKFYIWFEVMPARLIKIAVPKYIFTNTRLGSLSIYHSYLMYYNVLVYF